MICFDPCMHHVVATIIQLVGSHIQDFQVVTELFPPFLPLPPTTTLQPGLPSNHLPQQAGTPHYSITCSHYKQTQSSTILWCLAPIIFFMCFYLAETYEKQMGKEGWLKTKNNTLTVFVKSEQFCMQIFSLF